MIAKSLAAVHAYFKSSKSTAARAEELKLAGLFAAQLPAPLAEKLRRLSGMGNSLAFRNVCRMERCDGELFMLDCQDAKGGRRSTTSQGMVLFVSRKLNLPRMHVSPRPGRLENLLGPIFGSPKKERNIREGLARVSFSDEPHLESAFSVFSDAPERVCALLSGSRALWLRQLASPPEWDCEGDLLCVRATKPLPVRQGLENALALYRILTR